MDAGSPGGKLQRWVMEEFASQEEVSRGELVDHAQRSDLPQEVREAIAQMADGSVTKDRAVHQVVDILEVRAAGGARGQGNAPGRGGYGVQVEEGKPAKGGACPAE
jgi:hypothetical protein